MEKKAQTMTVDGLTFDVPDFKLQCDECDTVNIINEDSLPPFTCSDCGSKLSYAHPEPPIKSILNEWA